MKDRTMNKEEFIVEYETNFIGQNFRKDLNSLLSSESTKAFDAGYDYCLEDVSWSKKKIKAKERERCAKKVEDMEFTEDWIPQGTAEQHTTNRVRSYTKASIVKAIRDLK